MCVCVCVYIIHWHTIYRAALKCVSLSDVTPDNLPKISTTKKTSFTVVKYIIRVRIYMQLKNDKICVWLIICKNVQQKMWKNMTLKIQNLNVRVLKS